MSDNEEMPITCPLLGIGEIQEAWHAKRGDLVMLRYNVEWDEVAFEEMRFALHEITERTGVDFLVLGPGAEVVKPA